MERITDQKPSRGTRRQAEDAPDGEPSSRRPKPPNVSSQSSTIHTRNQSKMNSVIQGFPYYADGNLLLQVGGTHFRVYKSIIRRESEVIARILPADVEGNHCDHVKLKGDTAAEWSHVLLGMFDRR